MKERVSYVACGRRKREGGRLRNRERERTGGWRIESDSAGEERKGRDKK
jgi:hypothetical protein